MTQKFAQPLLAVLLVCFSATAFAMSDAERYQLLAPVALYPDRLLPELLTAARHPQQIREAHQWLENHRSRQDAGHNRHHWHSSVEVLLDFPHLLSRMSEHSHWTSRLGHAYHTDPESTLAAIQTLRHRAWERGSLQRMHHQKAYSHRGRIVIESRQRQQLYAPYYDPRRLYGQWPWEQHPPYYWQAPQRYQSGFYWEHRATDSGQFGRWQIQWERGRVIYHGRHQASERRPRHRRWELRAAPSIGTSHTHPNYRYRRSPQPEPEPMRKRPGRGPDAGADHSHVLPRERKRPGRRDDGQNGQRKRHSLLPGR